MVGDASFLYGLMGAVVGAGGALGAQFLNHRLTSGRELARFKVSSFERFAAQLSNDPELRRTRNKRGDLTEDEMERFLEFLEEVGVYFHRQLIDLELLDECLGDDIMDFYEGDYILD